MIFVASQLQEKFLDRLSDLFVTFVDLRWPDQSRWYGEQRRLVEDNVDVIRQFHDDMMV